MTPPIELTHIADVRALLQRHGFTFSKKLGQNFLINPTVCPRMAQACGIGKDGGVLEIGPGIGVLTRELAKVAGKVVAIELDDRLPPVLRETLADCDNVTVVQGDGVTVGTMLWPVPICHNMSGDAGGGMREPAVLHYIAADHAAARKPAAADVGDSDGAEGGGGAALCRAGHAGMRGGVSGGAVLCRAAAAVCGVARQLYAGAACGQRSDPFGGAPTAAGSGC